MPTNISSPDTPKLTQTKKEDTFSLRLTKGDLFRGLQTVQPAISSRTTLPVLSNILFEASDKGLRLSATDLEVGIRTWVKADILKTGAATVPAKILTDFVRTLEDDREVKIEAGENGKIEVRSGRDRLSLIGLPWADYPVLPEFDERKASKMPRTILRELVKKTIFAASTDETRYVLNGIHLIVEAGKAVAVATDGRRLSYIQRGVADKKLQVKIIVPTKAIQELLRLLGEEKQDQDELNVSFTDNQASFSTGDTVVLSRLIEGHFPNFEQVIPKTHEIQVTLRKSAFLASVTRASVGTLERGGSIKFQLSKGTLKIQASAQGRVEAESEIAVNYEGANFEIAFNPTFVIDVLKSMEQEEILLELTTPLNPGVIRPAGDENHRYIMMPMKG